MKNWWKESVIYQIYPKSFCDSNGDGIGDIRGIISKLDYLQTLGVDVIWISPIYESPDFDNGYDISDYQAIKQVFGSMDDFDELLSKAHQKGLKILMDLVVNHTSHLHPWFIESQQGKDSKKRDFYIWKQGKADAPPNNWGAWFGGSAWTKSPATDEYFLHIFSPYQPDLNWENAGLRQEVYQMMRWWLDKGIDGFRMDVISLISKHPDFPDGEIESGEYGNLKPFVANGPKVHDYLKEMRREVLSKYDIMTVGEASGVTIEEASKYANIDGSELNMVFQFEHMDLDGGETFKWNLDKIDLVELKKTLSKWQVDLEGKAWNSLYWCNHDQPRMLSRLGNTGDLREMSAKMLATCLHLMQGTPYIYQGEELGMTNIEFTDIAEVNDIESINAYMTLTQSGLYTEDEMLKIISYKGRDNARTPMQWDTTSNAGFTSGKPWIKLNPNYQTINAAEQLGREDSVYHYYRQLVSLRKHEEIVVYGHYHLHDLENKEVYAYTRTFDHKTWLIICNFQPHTVHYPSPLELTGKKVIIQNDADNSTYLVDHILKPFEAIVLEI